MVGVDWLALIGWHPSVVLTGRVFLTCTLREFARKEGKYILEKARVVLKRSDGETGDDTRVVGGSSPSDDDSE